MALVLTTTQKQLLNDTLDQIRVAAIAAGSTTWLVDLVIAAQSGRLNSFVSSLLQSRLAVQQQLLATYDPTKVQNTLSASVNDTNAVISQVQGT